MAAIRDGHEWRAAHSATSHALTLSGTAGNGYSPGVVEAHLGPGAFGGVRSAATPRARCAGNAMTSAYDTKSSSMSVYTAVGLDSAHRSGLSASKPIGRRGLDSM